MASVNIYALFEIANKTFIKTVVQQELGGFCQYEIVKMLGTFGLQRSSLFWQGKSNAGFPTIFGRVIKL